MNLHDIAKEVLAVLGTGRQLDPFSKVYPDFGLKDAYNVTATVRAGREARGERSIGRKIGFTNRTIWAEYGVYAPIWGYVYDHTVQDLTPEGLEVSLGGLAEPRIEPEIVFGLAAPPEPGMDEQALIRCLWPPWATLRRAPSFGGGAAGGMGARAFPFRGRPFPEWRPGRSRGRGERARWTPVRVAPSRRDAGRWTQSGARCGRNRDDRNADARLSGRRGRGMEHAPYGNSAGAGPNPLCLSEASPSTGRR
jgi:hypothetical protein